MPISISDPLGTASYYTPAGIKGDPGATGPIGLTGPMGSPGADGADSTVPGPRGYTGLTGPIGLSVAGPPGPAGSNGLNSTVAGPRGLTGLTGADSTVQGPIGLTGDPGNDGQMGPRGQAGVAGAQGPAGETGSTGPSGATGLNWYGNWSSTQNYVNNDAVFYNSASWFAQNDPAPGDIPSDASSVWFPLALQGETGPVGPTGPIGETGATGADSTVPGPTGPIGPIGPEGEKGETGDTGAPGADATLTQTVSNKSSSYTLIAGDAFKLIRSTGSAITLTIPDVLGVGDRVDFIQDGAGQITFSASGVTIQSKGGNLLTSEQYSAATVIKVAAGQYRLIGDLG